MASQISIECIQRDSHRSNNDRSRQDSQRSNESLSGEQRTRKSGNHIDNLSTNKSKKKIILKKTSSSNNLNPIENLQRLLDNKDLDWEREEKVKTDRPDT